MRHSGRTQSRLGSRQRRKHRDPNQHGGKKTKSRHNMPFPCERLSVNRMALVSAYSRSCYKQVATALRLAISGCRPPKTVHRRRKVRAKRSRIYADVCRSISQRRAPPTRAGHGAGSTRPGWLTAVSTCVVCCYRCFSDCNHKCTPASSPRLLASTVQHTPSNIAEYSCFTWHHPGLHTEFHSAFQQSMIDGE